MTKREAQKLGRARGRAAASWVFDGNTLPETFRKVIEMMDAGDPELFDSIRHPDWLSGEHAGESIAELLPDLPTDAERADDLMKAYEDAADLAFWETVERTARKAVA